MSVRHACPIHAKEVHLPLTLSPFLVLVPLALSRHQRRVVTFFLPTSGVLLPPRHLAQPSLFPFHPSIPGLSPSRLHAIPNLNPIFHITSRKSYSAAGQEAARRTKVPARRERRNIFIFSLPLSCLCCVLRILLPLHPDAAQSKTISEHIAQVRLRSLSRFQLPFLSPDFARFSSFSFSFSCRARPPLCRPAYSTLVEDVITRVPLPLLFPYFPSLSCFAVLAALLLVFHRARSSSEQEASEEAR